MTTSEKESVKKITTAWASNQSVKSLTLYGVNDGFREQLRDMINMPSEKFEIVK